MRNDVWFDWRPSAMIAVAGGVALTVFLMAFTPPAWFSALYALYFAGTTALVGSVHAYDSLEIAAERGARVAEWWLELLDALKVVRVRADGAVTLSVLGWIYAGASIALVALAVVRLVIGS